MANEEVEVIRHHMEETRTDLTDKLETLEAEVRGTVQNAKATVEDTVTSVKDAVHDTVDNVRGTMHETMDAVKSTFDVSHQVEQHPWLMLGGAVAVGYLGGCLLSEGAEEAHHSSASAYDPSYQAHVSGQSFASAPQASSSLSHWLGEMAETFKPEIAQLKGLAVGAALSMVRDVLKRSVPEQARQPLSDAVDKITIRLGGEPIEGLLPPTSSTSTGQRKPEPGRASYNL